MKRSPEWSLRLGQWPAADQRLWSEKMSSGTPFDDDRPGAGLSPATRRGRCYAYGAFLGFIAFHRPECLQLPPLSRVDRALVVDYVTFLRETRSDVSIAIDVERIHLVLVAFGATDIDWLRQLQRRIARNSRPKARPLVTADQLHRLGCELMDRAVVDADAGGSLHPRHCKMYRDGMMIAFLAAIPIRRRSFACLRIGEHLFKMGDLWKLNVPAEDTKNGVALEYDIGRNLSSRIDCYIERFRPGFPGAAGHDGVWASNRGTPMVGNTILQSVTRRTVAHFGFPVSPHRFRHAAASLWASANPENVRGAKDLLGHRSFAMTQKHYVQAQSRMAGRILALVIAGCCGDAQHQNDNQRGETTC